MKTLKNATQNNVLVNCEFYTMNELNAYLDEHVFFTLNEDFQVSYEHVSYVSNVNVRISLHDVKELKVIYNREYQCYTNVAVLNNGTNIYVTL